VTSPFDVTSDDIDSWADQISAAATLPTLVRRLLLATADLEQIDFPSDGGTRIGGWDGIAVIRAAHVQAPTGITGWEITVENNRRKLDRDFHQRATDERRGVAPRVGAYVAVTARHCGIKRSWATDKRDSGPWSDVRLLDADDLATWLSVAPSVRAWFGQVIGKPLVEVTDPTALIRKWSLRTSPPLPSGVVLAGKQRRALAEQLHKWAGRTRPGVLYVQADTHEEATLFVAAALSLPAAAAIDARTIILETPASWRWASNAQTIAPVILVPSFRDVDLGAGAATGASVIIPVGPELDLSRGANAVVLPRLPHGPLCTILVQNGWSEADAKRLTSESGGKLPALQQLCGPRGRSAWVARLSHAEATALLLAGSWAPANLADRKMLDALGVDPGNAERACTELSQIEGRPMEMVRDGFGPRCWRWAAEGEAWAALAPGLTESDLTGFAETVIAVLGADDPQYDMPAARRLYAGIEGKVLEHSDELRSGLARSLARLSQSDDVLARTLGPNRGSAAAAALVRKILQPAWRRWASVSELLPTLAEAAPERFLDQLDQSLLAGDEGVAHLLAEESTLGASPHAPLLWALEALAWNRSFCSRVAHALARLATTDPPGEGKLANRPARSLADILNPIIPQSASSAADRVAILSNIVRVDEAVAWKILVEPYAGGGGFYSPTHRPEIVDWELPPPLSPAQQAEVVAQARDSITLMLSLAKGRPEYLADLVKLSRHLPPDMEARLLDAVAAIVPTKSTSDPTGIVWAALRYEIYLSHLAGDRSGPTSGLTRLKELYADLAPVDLAREVAWLFHPSPAIPERRAGDLTLAERRRDELQDNAICRVLAAPISHEVLARLCTLTEYPGLVGRALARSEWATDFVLGSAGAFSDVPEAAAPGLLAALSQQKGLPWLQGILIELARAGKSETVIRTLGFLPTRESTWDIVDIVGGDAKLGYWSRLNGVWGTLSRPENERAVNEFLVAGRVGLALQTVSHAKDEIEPATALSVLKAARTGDHTRMVADVGANMFDYHLAKVFERADVTGEEEAIGLLELFFFQPLDGSERPPRHIYQALKDQPKLFVQMLCWIFVSQDAAATDSSGSAQEQADDASGEEPSADDVERAKASARILHSWDGYPGEDAAPPEQERILIDWVRAVLTLAQQEGRIIVAESHVGAVLARAPSGPDGVWPCLAAREIISGGTRPAIARALGTAEGNRLGMSSRGHLDGGDRERDLASKYRQDADKIRTTWPDTAAILNNLAAWYDHEAKRHDEAVADARIRYGE
jgi:hypothetical protein